MNIENQILPQLDLTILQHSANEAAMQGAISAINEFYTGWNSPYKKAIEADLESKSIDPMFSLPDILGVINEKLQQEIDSIANAAVAKSFVPLVKQITMRAEPEIMLSDIMKKFINCTDYSDRRTGTLCVRMWHL